MMGAAQRRYAAVVARKHSAVTQHSKGNIVANPNQVRSKKNRRRHRLV